jgi:hypothetical protein
MLSSQWRLVNPNEGKSESFTRYSNEAHYKQEETRNE